MREALFLETSRVQQATGKLIASPHVKTVGGGDAVQINRRLLVRDRTSEGVFVKREEQIIKRKTCRM